MVVWVILKDYKYEEVIDNVPCIKDTQTDIFIGIVKDFNTVQNIIEIFFDQLLDDVNTIDADEVKTIDSITDDANIKYELKLKTVCNNYDKYEYVCYKTKRIEL